jgi:SynChlorMet cassette radical SAM/SPASM protein ScmE
VIQRGELSAPINVFLNVTNRCNLRCSHCMTSAGGPQGDELSTEEWLALIRRLAELKVFRARVTGGEPLVRPDLFRLLEELQRRRIVIHLNSNATLVDRDVARRLAELSLLKVVNVSLDGSCAEVHDRLRGLGAFERAVRGVEAMVAEGLRVQIAAVVTRLNQHDLEPMIRLARRLGVVGIGFNNLHPAGRVMGHRQDLWLAADERRAVGQRLAVMQQKNDGFMSTTFTRWHGMLSTPPKEIGRSGHIHVCSAGVETCAICANGDVLACNAAPGFVCGNVRSQDLADIWLRSPQMRAVRALVHLTTEDVEGCRTCPYRCVCDTGCRADAWSMTGSWTGGPAAICWHGEVGL